MNKLTALSIIFRMIGYCQAIGQKRVLVYTKVGSGYAHENIPASVAALKNICKEEGVAVDVSDDASVFADENLRQYKVIIFSNTNNEAFDTQEQRDAFVRYVHNGGGFVGIHSACASERQWSWFWAMLGGKFVTHPKLQPFDIKVIDHNHPATEFLGKVWKWEDECYYMNHFNPDISVLLAVDLRTIEDKDKTKYPGEVFGNYIPIAWYHTFEGGRQFFTALGHKIEHYSDPVFIKHLRGGIIWALGEE